MVIMMTRMMMFGRSTPYEKGLHVCEGVGREIVNTPRDSRTRIKNHGRGGIDARSRLGRLV